VLGGQKVEPQTVEHASADEVTLALASDVVKG
jgi:hypothetical protein